MSIRERQNLDAGFSQEGNSFSSSLYGNNARMTNVSSIKAERVEIISYATAINGEE